MSKRHEEKEHKARLAKAREEGDLIRDQPKHPNKKLNVTLPIAPSVNSAYYFRRGKPVPKKSTRDYVIQAKALIRQAMEQQRWTVPSRGTWLYMDIVVYQPDRIRRDSHNMNKIMIDCFNKIAFYDDYNVMPRINMVRLDVENPRMCIQIRAQRNSDLMRYDSAVFKAFGNTISL